LEAGKQEQQEQGQVLDQMWKTTDDWFWFDAFFPSCLVQRRPWKPIPRPSLEAHPSTQYI